MDATGDAGGVEKTGGKLRKRMARQCRTHRLHARTQSAGDE